MRQPNRTAISVAIGQLLLIGAPCYAQAQSAPAAESGPQVITVKGQRKALETAQEIKRNADEVVDSVTAEEAGKLPDRSITEVLQRVVGVTVQRQRTIRDDAFHFSEEGSGIKVRGLSWGSSNLNGREIFSAGWPGKDLSWGAVPTELMVGVDTYKNPSAERIEGAISGLVDLRTGMPFDYQGTKNYVSFGVNYSASSKKSSPSLSGLYTTQWDSDIGRLGFLVDLATNKSAYAQDNLQLEPYYPRTDVVPGKTVWAPRGVNWGSNLGETQRNGIYTALQWRKNDMESGLTFFLSKSKDVDQGSNIYSSIEHAYKSVITGAEIDDRGNLVKGHYTYPGLVTDADGTTHSYGYGANQFAFGGIKMGTSRFYNVNDTQTGELAWNFKWKINDRWSIQNDLQWVNSKFETTGRQIQIATFMPSVDIAVNGNSPAQFSFDQATRDHLANPKNYYWDIIQPKLYRGDSNLYAWKADAKFVFEDPVLRDARFGMRLSARDSERQEASFASDPGGTGWKSIAVPWEVARATEAGVVPVGRGRGNFGYIDAPGSNGNYTYPTDLFSYANLAGGRMGNLPSVVFPTYDLIRDYPRAYAEIIQKVQYQQCLDGYALNGGRQNPPAENTCKLENFKFDPTLLYNQGPQHTSNANLQTAAVYGNLRFGFDDWKVPVEGNVGVRAVYTRVKSRGYIKFDNEEKYKTAPDSLPRFAKLDEPLNITHSHVDLLPSLNLKANFSDKLQGRLAMARSVYRPDFKQLQENIQLKQDYNAGGNSATYTGENNGNAKLKPLTADSFDVSLEWYPKRGQSLTAVAFYKKVKDIIYDSTYTRTYNTTAGLPQTFVITGPANMAQANLRGIELSADSYLDHFDALKGVLPDWAKGLGVSANYTYIDSDQTFYRDGGFKYCPTGEVKNSAMQIYGCDTNGLPFARKLPMKGVTKNAANLALRYDGDKFSVRLAYNWNSRSLLELVTGGNQCYDDYCPGGTSADPARAGKTDTWYGLPKWQEAYGQWDLGGSYNFTSKFSVSFSVSNINNVTVRETYQQNNGTVGTAWRFPGQTYNLSGRLEF